MQKNQRRPTKIHKPRKQQHPQNTKLVTDGDLQIHHKTQKNNSIHHQRFEDNTTKPKIGPNLSHHRWPDDVAAKE